MIDNKMSVSSIPAPQTPRAKPRFIFSDKSSVISTYESYAKNGFAHLITNQAEFPFYQKNKFLSSVDLTKGPVFVSVQSIIRIMAVDWDSPKRERKEYFHYTAQCEAKNYKNNVIRYTQEAEGKHVEQTKQIETRRDQKTGEDVDLYVRGTPRDCYTIPWDKKKAQELLTSEKIFGEDSLNITNLNEVQYTVKFSNSNPPRTAFSQEDFLNLTYQALSDKSKTTPSIHLEALRRKQNPYG
jgi:hypothetical protein